MKFHGNQWFAINNKANSLSVSFFILLLATIPMYNLVNTIVFILFLLTLFVYQSKNEKYSFTNTSLLLISVFSLAFISMFWSVDFNRTLNTLPRILPFLLLPISLCTNNFFSKQNQQQIIKWYSFIIVLYVIYYTIRAFVIFLVVGDETIFFHHELVSKEVNAVHVSVFVAIAFFYFFTIKNKSIWDTLYCFFLFGFIILLNSYTILITVVLLIIINYFYFSKDGSKMRLRNLVVLGLGVFSLLFAGKIEKMIEKEIETKTEKTLSHTVIEKQVVGNSVISVEEAWTKTSFKPNDFFPGTAFRVLQFRFFIEMMQENEAWLMGFGLNASYVKIEEKAKQYNLFLGNETQEGYQKKNFHNQYIQTFADLGVFGFLLLIVILRINLKNALQNKDFVHFAFAILMISLFLTESFLLRQRGIMFFTSMYCLFNCQSLLVKTKS
jgi:O-antigen ligase